MPQQAIGNPMPKARPIRALPFLTAGRLLFLTDEVPQPPRDHP
jgi:hypothetical protein